MLSQVRHARWVHRDHEIQRLRARQLGIAAIARRVQVSRPTVYRYLAMSQPPERQRSRHRGQPLIEPFTPYLRRRTVERYVGRPQRETGTRCKFRQAAPAPLYAEGHDENHPSALTALRRGVGVRLEP
jgi:hypothetical protein